MKKLLFAIAISLMATSMLVGCGSSPESTAKKLIKERLKHTLADWSTYESVDYGSLDTIFGTYDDDSIIYGFYCKIVDARFSMTDYSMKCSPIYDDSTRMAAFNKVKELDDSLALFCDSLNMAIANFKPGIKGYCMEHTYRTNSIFGKAIFNKMFVFDKDLTEVLADGNVDQYKKEYKEKLDGIKELYKNVQDYK